MKKVVVALAALACAAPAFAQQQAGTEHRSQIGLGISINPQAAVSPTVEVYVPIQVGPALRIEPSLGIATNNAPAGGTDTSDITLGVGVFVQQRVAPVVDLYAGGRLKLNFASADAGAAGSDSGTDVIVAAAVGGEYYIAPKFSLGLEGQLGFFSNSRVSGDNSGFFTTGLGFFRVYF